MPRTRNAAVYLGIPLLAIAVLVWLGVPTSAHEESDHPVRLAQLGAGEHGHESPHGGSVVSVGDRHFELGVTEQIYWVYVLDESLETLPVEGVTGRLTVTGEGGVTTLDLAVVDDHLEASSETPIADELVAVIQLTIDGTALTGRINYARPTPEPSDHPGDHPGEGDAESDEHGEHAEHGHPTEAQGEHGHDGHGGGDHH